MVTDNSAARLLAILETGIGINPNVSAKDAWMNILGVNSDTPNAQSIFMSKLGQVMLLPHEIKIIFDQYYPYNSTTLDYTLGQIQKAFSNQNLAQSWGGFINYIDTHCISTLSMASALLDSKLESKLIEKIELNSFKDKVMEILDEVIHSDLTHEFKKFMTHYLNKILSSIDDYFISGAMPILLAVESTIGHAVLDPNFKNELIDTTTGDKIRHLLADLANMTTVATAASGATLFLASNGFNLLN